MILRELLSRVLMEYIPSRVADRRAGHMGDGWHGWMHGAYILRPFTMRHRVDGGHAMHIHWCVMCSYHI